MWRGLSRLTWLEIKIFLREPLGALGTILVPVVIFVGLGRLAGGSRTRATSLADSDLVRADLPVFASVLIAISAVLSLVTIISIAVSLLRGIWKGEAWSAHMGDVGALAVACVVCAALSATVFRWE